MKTGKLRPRPDAEWDNDEKIENPFTLCVLSELLDSRAYHLFCVHAMTLRAGNIRAFIATDVDVKVRALDDARLLIKSVRSRTFGGI